MLDYYTNQRVAVLQSLTLPARIRMTTSADGSFHFGLGNSYLRQVILTSPTVATWVLGCNLTDTPNTAHAAFKADMDVSRSVVLPHQTIQSVSRLLHCRTDTPPTSTCLSAEHFS